jgi:hypothetical protein
MGARNGRAKWAREMGARLDNNANGARYSGASSTGQSDVSWRRWRRRLRGAADGRRRRWWRSGSGATRAEGMGERVPS